MVVDAHVRATVCASVRASYRLVVRRHRAVRYVSFYSLGRQSPSDQLSLQLCTLQSTFICSLLLVPSLSLFLSYLFLPRVESNRNHSRVQTLVPRNSTTYLKGALLENVLSSIVYLYYYKYEKICAPVPAAHQPSITTSL